MFSSLFSNTRKKGKYYEQVAEQYLIKNGLTPVTRNYHCKGGEIDLIMQEGDTWIFIEVKYRKNNAFGGAIHSLTPTKRQRIQHSIFTFLRAQGLHNVPLRVDFVAIQGDYPHLIHWIKSI